MDLNKEPDFDGADYQPDRDKQRLTTGQHKVRMYMENAGWKTIMQISEALDMYPPSVSADLRNLRKERFGGRTVDRRYVRNGVYEYYLVPEKKDD